jgi:hypothetical protein
VGSTSFVKKIANKIVNKNWIFEALGYVIVLLILLLCVAFLLTNTYNPFIYFRF